VAARRAFAYTVLRLVPRIERGECVNVGVVLFCREHGFLGVRIDEAPDRWLALFPALDTDAVLAALRATAAVIAGVPEAGALAALPPSERFGWVSAPSSTILQPAPVHTGLTGEPAAMLDRLFCELVLAPVT
jgi:hypothetical protein